MLRDLMAEEGGGCPSPSLLLSPRPRFCFLFANLDSSVSSKVDRVPEGPGRMGSAGSCSQGRWPAVSALVAPGELGRQGWRRFCWPQCPGRGVSPWAEARVSGSKQCPHFISAAAAAAASSLSCELATKEVESRVAAPLLHLVAICSQLVPLDQ